MIICSLYAYHLLLAEKKYGTFLGGILMDKFLVELENVTKQFGNYCAVDNVSLQIKQGEFLTLLGPSGCGKTTSLRMIAGFDKPSSGNIIINKQIVNDIEPYHREINTVFQQYSLFPHMSIFNNIAFGLKMKKIPKSEIAERVHNMLQLVQLSEYKDRKPDQLSGGQKQRIAIARAIVNNPQVLLLDEPLGALDLKLRKQMQLELKHLQQTLGITFIYVTHDQEEALTMSDRIVVMNKGKIEQIDEPRELYENPKTLFVANFIGDTNILHGFVHKQVDSQLILNISSDKMALFNKNSFQENEPITVSIRPEKIRFVPIPQTNELVIQVKTIETIYLGSITKVVVELKDGQKIVVQTTDGQHFSENELAYITWNPHDCLVYDARAVNR